MSKGSTQTFEPSIKSPEGAVNTATKRLPYWVKHTRIYIKSEILRREGWPVERAKLRFDAPADHLLGVHDYKK